MKNKNVIITLVIIISVLSFAAAALGVFSGWGDEAARQQFQSISGENITLHGKGIYQNDSVSIAAQGISQDIVTLIMGIPLLLISLILACRGTLKGRLLLTGTVGYFLYTYTSYSFLCMYNYLFLVYVALMSASLFAFILCMVSFDIESLKSAFSEKMPVKFIGGFQIFIAFTLLMMWLGKIAPTIVNGSAPLGLEHYATLVIQAMDLGIIVPAAAMSGVLIIKRKSIGYLLSSVIIIKGLTMLTALSAMIIGQVLAGVEVGLAVMVIFPGFNLTAVLCLIILMKSVKEKTYTNKVGNYSL